MVRVTPTMRERDLLSLEKLHFISFLSRSISAYYTSHIMPISTLATIHSRHAHRTFQKQGQDMKTLFYTTDRFGGSTFHF